MRILILGAGGIGGYYGARLVEAAADVTFLVRPRRAAQLAASGLVMRSFHGDVADPVKTIQREQAAPGFDVILLSCKAYDLEDAIATIAPAAPGALILPMMNGLRQLDRLDAAFGIENVAGGVAAIGATLEPDGTVRHLTRTQGFIFGPRHKAQQARCEALAAQLARCKLETTLSPDILQDMWEKFAFLACHAGMTSLMHGAIGAINRSAHGTALMREILDDCTAAAAAAGHAPRPAPDARTRGMLLDPASDGTSSMMRDMLAGGRVEADHVLGDMLARVQALGLPATLLRAAYTHLQVYQEGRKEKA